MSFSCDAGYGRVTQHDHLQPCVEKPHQHHGGREPTARDIYYARKLVAIPLGHWDPDLL